MWECGNGIDSSLKQISIGVLQGSILGPILFLIYINDLPDISSNLNFTLFADDTTVTLSGEDLPSLTSQVNNELNLLNDWAIQNRLTINTDKTEYILFSNRLANIDDIQLKIGQDKLTLTTNYKFLGIDLDNKLKFNNHIKSVVSKVAKSNGILYRIRKFLSIEARIHFYYAFVYPYLSYNVSIWGNSNEITLKPLIIAQKRVIRCLADAEYNAHTSPLFKKYQLLKFEDIVEYVLCIYMYKSIKAHKLSPARRANTRNQNDTRSSFQRLTTCHKYVNVNPSNV